MNIVNLVWRNHINICLCWHHQIIVKLWITAATTMHFKTYMWINMCEYVRCSCSCESVKAYSRRTHSATQRKIAEASLKNHSMLVSQSEKLRSADMKKHSSDMCYDRSNSQLTNFSPMQRHEALKKQAKSWMDGNNRSVCFTDWSAAVFRTNSVYVFEWNVKNLVRGKANNG